MRAVAQDPYGFMKFDCSNKNKVYSANFSSQDEHCHAKLIFRKVDPDPEGNEWGLYGCTSHQHPLSRQNTKSEIIFILI